MMSLKLHILFVACIICILILDEAVARPNITNTEFNLLEDTGLDVSGDLERVKRRGSCGWSSGCHKGYCYANCQGGFGTLSKLLIQIFRSRIVQTIFFIEF